MWKVGKFQGDAEHTLRAEVLIMATTKVDKKPWVKPPIAMQFQVRALTCCMGGDALAPAAVDV